MRELVSEIEYNIARNVTLRFYEKRAYRDALIKRLNNCIEVISKTYLDRNKLTRCSVNEKLVKQLASILRLRSSTNRAASFDPTVSATITSQQTLLRHSIEPIARYKHLVEVRRTNVACAVKVAATSRDQQYDGYVHTGIENDAMSGINATKAVSRAPVATEKRPHSRDDNNMLYLYNKQVCSIDRVETNAAALCGEITEECDRLISHCRLSVKPDQNYLVHMCARIYMCISVRIYIYIYVIVYVAMYVRMFFQIKI